MKKSIGIIGGMGPLATCDLYRKIIQVTTASCDQDHIRVCIDGNTKIPDRTEAILHGGENPVSEMIKSALRLEGMGVDVLIMPCNTAHYFYSHLSSFVDVPFINMIEETANVIADSGIKKIGLLATDGTIRSGVYEKTLSDRGIIVEKPDTEGQEAVMELIYQGVKSGNYNMETSRFEKTTRSLLDKGAEVLVLGCTELPLAFQKWKFSEPTIDPTLVLATKAVAYVTEDEKSREVIWHDSTRCNSRV